MKASRSPTQNRIAKTTNSPISRLQPNNPTANNLNQSSLSCSNIQNISISTVRQLAEPTHQTITSRMTFSEDYTELQNALQRPTEAQRSAAAQQLFCLIQKRNYSPALLFSIDFQKLLKSDQNPPQRLVECYWELLKYEKQCQLNYNGMAALARVPKHSQYFIFLYAQRYKQLIKCLWDALQSQQQHKQLVSLSLINLFLNVKNVKHQQFLTDIGQSLMAVIMTDSDEVRILTKTIFDKVLSFGQSFINGLPKIIQDLIVGPGIDSCSFSVASSKQKSRTVDKIQDPLRKFTEQWVEKVNKLTKHQEKIKMIQELQETLKTASHSNIDHRHLSKMIKQLIVSNNTQLTQISLQVISGMARCLNKAFENDAKDLLPVIFSKYKDKKTQVQQEIEKCLKQIQPILSVEDIIATAYPVLEDKNPNMRINLINFILRAIEDKTAQQPSYTLSRPAQQQLFNRIFPMLMKDNSSQVRNASMCCLKCLEPTVNRDEFSVFLDIPNNFKIQPKKKIESSRKIEIEVKPTFQNQLKKMMEKVKSQMNPKGQSQKICQLAKMIQPCQLQQFPSTLIPQLCRLISNLLVFKSNSIVISEAIMCLKIIIEKGILPNQTTTRQIFVELISLLKVDSLVNIIQIFFQQVQLTTYRPIFMNAVCVCLEQDQQNQTNILKMLQIHHRILKLDDIRVVLPYVITCLVSKIDEIRRQAVEFISCLQPFSTQIMEICKQHRPSFLNVVQGILFPNIAKRQQQQIFIIESNVNELESRLVEECYPPTINFEKFIKSSLDSILDRSLVEKMMSVQTVYCLEAATFLQSIFHDNDCRYDLESISNNILQWTVLRLWDRNSGLVSLLNIPNQIVGYFQKNKRNLRNLKFDHIVRIIQCCLLVKSSAMLKKVQSFVEILSDVYGSGKLEETLQEMKKIDLLTLFPDIVSDDIERFQKAIDKLLNVKIEIEGEKQASDLKESLEQMSHSPYAILNRQSPISEESQLISEQDLVVQQKEDKNAKIQKKEEIALQQPKAIQKPAIVKNRTYQNTHKNVSIINNVNKPLSNLDIPKPPLRKTRRQSSELHRPHFPSPQSQPSPQFKHTFSNLETPKMRKPSDQITQNNNTSLSVQFTLHTFKQQSNHPLNEFMSRLEKLQNGYKQSIQYFEECLDRDHFRQEIAENIDVILASTVKIGVEATLNNTSCLLSLNFIQKILRMLENPPADTISCLLSFLLEISLGQSEESRKAGSILLEFMSLGPIICLIHSFVLVKLKNLHWKDKLSQLLTRCLKRLCQREPPKNINMMKFNELELAIGQLKVRLKKQDEVAEILEKIQQIFIKKIIEVGRVATPSNRKSIFGEIRQEIRSVSQKGLENDFGLEPREDHLRKKIKDMKEKLRFIVKEHDVLKAVTNSRDNYHIK